MNGDGKLRRCTEQRHLVVDVHRYLYLYLAAALVVISQPIQRACTRSRWPTRPTARHLKYSLLSVALISLG